MKGQTMSKLTSQSATRRSQSIVGASINASSVACPDQMDLEGTLEIQAAKKGEEDAPAVFKLVANTGTPMDLNGFMDPVVIDLTGARFDKPRTPIIADHDTTKRIGHTTSQTVEANRIVAEGLASSSMGIAQGFVADARKGFPFQVSVGAKIEKGFFVEAGDKVTVNGKTFKGPLIVAQKTRIRELSITVLGADGNTAAKVAAKSSSENALQLESRNMKFEEFVKAMGFKLEDLTAAQKTALTSQWEANVKAEADAKIQTTTPAVPDVQATAPATELDLTVQRNAQADETLRVNTINATASRYDGLTDVEFNGVKYATLAAAQSEAIRNGSAPDAFELAVIRAERPNHGQEQAPAGHIDNRDLNAQALEVAIASSIGVPMSEHANGKDFGLEHWYPQEALEASDKPQYADVGLHWLMDMNIHAATGNPWTKSRKSRDYVRAFLQANQSIQAADGFSTLAVSNILENVANKALLASYSAQEVVWDRICGRKRLSDFKAHSFYRLNVDGGYEKVGASGELKSGTFSDDKYSVQADTYGMILGLNRQDMTNDDLDAFESIPTNLGRLAALAIESAVMELLLANANSFFHANNNNLNTGAGSDLTIAGLTASATAFQNQVDANGRPILISPDRILVGTQDTVNGADLFQQTSVATRLDSSDNQVVARNPHAGSFKPSTSAMLNNTNALQMDGSAFSNQTSDHWYMFTNPAVLAAILIGFLNGNANPVIESAEVDFSKLGMQWRSYHDWGVAQGDPKAAQKNNGA